MELNGVVSEGNRKILKSHPFFVSNTNTEYVYTIYGEDSRDSIVSIKFLFKNTNDAGSTFYATIKNLIQEDKEIIITFININKSISDVIILNDIDLFKTDGSIIKANVSAKVHRDTDVVEVIPSIISEYIE